MGLLCKYDLKRKDNYNWDESQGEDYENAYFPTNAVFNRNEGYEVLAVINVVARKRQITEKSVGLEIERLIHDDMPVFIKNRNNAIRWLRDYIIKSV